MTKQELFEKLQEILSNEFDIAKETVTLDANLYESLELDSIDAVDLLVKMKGYLKDKIEPEQFKKAVTVQDVVDILHPLIKE